MLEPADASNSLGGIIRAGLQRRSAEQSDGGGEGRGHASVSGVESGVGVRQGDAGANEAVNAPALGIGGGDVVGAPQVEGVVGDDQIDIAADGLVDDGGDRVHGEQNGVDGFRGVAADKPIGVPGLGQVGRSRGAQCCDDVSDGQGVDEDCLRIGGIRSYLAHGCRLDEYAFNHG